MAGVEDEMSYEAAMYGMGLDYSMRDLTTIGRVPATDASRDMVFLPPMYPAKPIDPIRKLAYPGIIGFVPAGPSPKPIPTLPTLPVSTKPPAPPTTTVQRPIACPPKHEMHKVSRKAVEMLRRAKDARCKQMTSGDPMALCCPAGTVLAKPPAVRPPMQVCPPGEVFKFPAGCVPKDVIIGPNGAPDNGEPLPGEEPITNGNGVVTNGNGVPAPIDEAELVVQQAGIMGWISENPVLAAGGAIGIGLLAWWMLKGREEATSNPFDKHLPADLQLEHDLTFVNVSDGRMFGHARLMRGDLVRVGSSGPYGILRGWNTRSGTVDVDWREGQSIASGYNFWRNPRVVGTGAAPTNVKCSLKCQPPWKGPRANPDAVRFKRMGKAGSQKYKVYDRDTGVWLGNIQKSDQLWVILVVPEGFTGAERERHIFTTRYEAAAYLYHHGPQR